MNTKLKIFRVQYFCFGDKYESIVLEEDVLKVTEHILNKENEIYADSITLIEEVYPVKGTLIRKEI